MRGRLRIATAAAIVATAVLVGWRTTGPASSATGSPSSTDRMVGAKLATAPATTARDLTPGVEHTYAVEMEHRVTQASGKPFIVRVGGEWSAAVVGDEPRGAVLRAELHRGVRSVVADGGHVVSIDTPGLDRPYYLTLAGDGSVVSLQFERGIDDATRTALASVTAAAQIVGADRAAQTWEADERDTLGPYQATYRREERGLHKAKTAYTLTGIAAAEVLRSATTIALRDDGWPASIEGSESVRVGTEHVLVTGDAVVRFTHLRVRRGVATGVPTGLDMVALDTSGASSRISEEDDLKLLAGASLDELLEDLRVADHDLKTTTRAYLRLAILFRIDPAAAQAASKAVIDGLAPERASSVIGALGRAGTPEAQHALGGVLEASRLDVASRERAAVALGLTREPTRETIADLTTIAAGTGELADAALLAVGSTARSAGSFDVVIARQTVDDLLAKLSSARDDEDRARVIRALGNTGDPRVLPALEQAIGSRSSLLRSVGIEALRLLPGAQVDTLVVRAVADPVVEIRSAAVFAAGYRDLSPLLDALATAGRRDPDPGLRQQIVELAGSRRGVPALRAIVEWAAANDRDAKVREAARTLLEYGD